MPRHRTYSKILDGKCAAGGYGSENLPTTSESKVIDALLPDEAPIGPEFETRQVMVLMSR